MENQKLQSLLKDLNAEDLEFYTNSIDETVSAVAILSSAVLDSCGNSYVIEKPPLFPFRLDMSLFYLQRLNEVLKAAKA